MGPSVRKCQVCNDAQFKYKCPSCLAPYCSLLCFRSHKETPCAKPEPTKEKSFLPELPMERSLGVDEPSEMLQKEQLVSIASSSEICNALKDESLQKIILGIDSSSDVQMNWRKLWEWRHFVYSLIRFYLLSGPDNKQLSPQQGRWSDALRDYFGAYLSLTA